MRLKRNILSSVICAVFILIAGYSCYQISYRFIMDSHEPLILGGVMILGTAVFFMLSYFIRRRGYLDFMESNHFVMIFLECFAVIAAETALWFMDESLDLSQKIYMAAVLFLIYLVSRMAGGRLSGMISVSVGWICINSSHIQHAEERDYHIAAGFLLSYCIFYLITRYVSRFVKSKIFTCFIYFLYAAVFIALMADNPMAVTLFFFSLYCLLFSGKEASSKTDDNLPDEGYALSGGNDTLPDGGHALSGENGTLPDTDNFPPKSGKNNKEKKSLFDSGYFYAMLLMLFSLVILFVINTFIIVMLEEESLFVRMYHQFMGLLDQVSGGVNANVGILDNVLKGMNINQLPFGGELMIAFLFLFAAAGGGFMIVKKYCYMKPLAMSFTGFAAAAVLISAYGEKSALFLFFLLPVFAGYGFQNILIAEEDGEKELDLSQEEDIFIPVKSGENAEYQVWEFASETANEMSGRSVETISEPEPALQTTEEVPEPEPTLQTAEEVPEPALMIQKAERASEPELMIQKAEGASEPELMIQKAEKVSETEPTIQKPERISEPESAIQKPIGTLISAEMSETANKPIVNEDKEDNSLSFQDESGSGLFFVSENEMKEPSLKETGKAADKVPNELNLDSGLNEKDNNTELFFSVDHENKKSKTYVNDTRHEQEWNMDEDIPEYQEALNDDYIDLKSSLGEDYNSDLSENEKKTESNLAVKRDTQASEDARLNHLLERLDLTENIKRMNASTQEDMAEVIEKTSSSNDLENAIPTPNKTVAEEDVFVINDKTENKIEEEGIKQKKDPIVQEEAVQQKKDPIVQEEAVQQKKEAIVQNKVISSQNNRSRLTRNEPSPQQEEMLNHGLARQRKLNHDLTSDKLPPSDLNAESICKTETVNKKTRLGTRTYHRIVIK